MFICCKKNLHVREGGEELSLQSGFVGPIDDRWAGHWYIKAAMKDGTIVASEVAAREVAEKKATTGKSKGKGKNEDKDEDASVGGESVEPDAPAEESEKSE